MLSYFLNHLLSGGADGGSVVRLLGGPRRIVFFFVNQTKQKKFCKFIITRVILLLNEMSYFKNTYFYIAFCMHLVLYEWMYSITILLILYQDCLPTRLTHFMYSIIRDYNRITQRNWIIFCACSHVFFTNGVLLPIIIWCTKNIDDVWSIEYAFSFMLALFMWRKNFVIEIFQRICLCERLTIILKLKYSIAESISV